MLPGDKCLSDLIYKLQWEQAENVWPCNEGLAREGIQAMPHKHSTWEVETAEANGFSPSSISWLIHRVTGPSPQCPPLSTEEWRGCTHTEVWAMPWPAFCHWFMNFTLSITLLLDSHKYAHILFVNIVLYLFLFCSYIASHFSTTYIHILHYIYFIVNILHLILLMLISEVSHAMWTLY